MGRVVRYAANHQPVFEKQCSVCGEFFEGISKAVYCSNRCAQKAKYAKATGKLKVCAIDGCGRVFEPRHGRKYCGDDCRRQAQELRAYQR